VDQPRTRSTLKTRSDPAHYESVSWLDVARPARGGSVRQRPGRSAQFRRLGCSVGSSAGTRRWQTIAGAHLVCWYWPDDDVRYEELDADRWAARHVEVRGQDDVIVTAAALVEVLTARDDAGIEAGAAARGNVRGARRSVSCGPDGLSA
jgi:hypothetical protein